MKGAQLWQQANKEQPAAAQSTWPFIYQSNSRSLLVWLDYVIRLFPRWH